MGKVKGEDKFPNELVAIRKRKKRKKELDILRRNVLEAKRKLREKTAPPKIHTSTFNKILNSFADRRQANDNKTQGFDNKGKRAGLKKICNRLLPSRKPQVGIFANGSKGAEIKRVDLSLSESDRARLEGDLQKVLCDGKRKCKESRSDVLNEKIQKPSVKAVDMETQEFIRNPERKLERKLVQNFVPERQSGKRKIQVPIELEGKTAKKPHSEVEDAKVEIQCDKVKSEWKNLKEKKWKKSLFQNEVEDFEPIVEPGFEQLRFSPIIGRAKAEPIPSERKVFLDINDKRPDTKTLNFKCGQLGRLAAAKYQELCSMVCAENFDTCLQEIPHIDPLTKVKQSLVNFYTETCNQKALQNKLKPEVLSPEESSSTSSCTVHSNVRETKYFDLQDEYLEKSKSDRMNDSPVRGVCLGNLKNFRHQGAAETSSARSQPLMMEAPEVNKSKNIPCMKRGPPSSETSIIERNASSLDVNYDSPRKSFRSDVLESLKIDDEVGPSVAEQDDRTASSRLAGIPSHRKKTMLRYLKEVNNFEPPEKEGANCPTELSATSAENDDLQKYHIGDPLRRNEIRMKQTQNVPRKKLLSETNIAQHPGNSLDVNYHGNLKKIDGKARPMIVNLGSASSSILARIPSDRKEFMLRYLQDVNNPEVRKKYEAVLRPEVFAVVAEDAKHQKRQLGDQLRKHEVKNTSVERLGKSERHVPAILRKSQAVKKNKKSSTADTILAKGVLEIGNLRWKTSNFKFQKMSSDSEITTVDSLSRRKESSRKPPPTEYLFPIDSDNSNNPESLTLTKSTSQASQYYHDRAQQPETQRVSSGFYDLNENVLNIKRNFMDEIVIHKSETGQQNIARTSGGVDFSAEFNPRSPEICCRVNYTDKAPLSNFHSRQPQNSPILLHQNRPDSTVHRIDYDESMMSSLGNHVSQRFPVFLKRKAAPSTQNNVLHEGRLFPENGNIIQSPNLRGICHQDGNREINVQHMMFKNKDQGVQRNDGELAFPKYPGGMQMAPLKVVQVQNGRQKPQQFQAPHSSFHNDGQQVGQLQIPRCGCEGDVQNEQHVRLPGMLYHNGVQKVVNRGCRVQEVGNNPVNFFEPTTFNAPASQRIFQRDPSTNAQMPVSASYGSSYRGNANFESHHGCSSAEPVQFFDRRVGFVLPKNDQELFCQNATDLPIITQQVTHRQYHSPVLSGNKNHNYKYVIDPRYPQAGYQWNQIDQSGAQIHQRIIQPAYNVTDAYRTQVPHSYFSTDS